MSQSASSSSEAPGTDHDGFSVTQRAILAAREAERFAADAKKRQMAGIKVKSKAKGKSTAKAASKFGVSTRAVELVKIVLAKGGKQLVELLWIGRVSIRAAIKLARVTFDRVRDRVVAEIVGGRPAKEAIVAAGIQERKPQSFDDAALSKSFRRLGRQLDRRAAALGGCERYRQARGYLWLANKAFKGWLKVSYDAPAPVILDAYGRQAPAKVAREFQIVGEMGIVCEQITAIAKQVEGLTRRPGSQLIHIKPLLCLLNKACELLWNARPVLVCSHCPGPRCEFCHGRGWMPAPEKKPPRRHETCDLAPLPLPPPKVPVPAGPAPANPSPPKPTLCFRCRPLGFANCPDCTLANDPGYERIPGMGLVRTRRSVPYDERVPWFCHLADDAPMQQWACVR